MKIQDPLPFMGIDSGIRVIKPSAAEARVLLRAAEILDKGHDLITAIDVDHQDDTGTLTDAFCMAPPAIRELVAGEIRL